MSAFVFLLIPYFCLASTFYLSRFIAILSLHSILFTPKKKNFTLVKRKYLQNALRENHMNNDNKSKAKTRECN